MVLIFLLMSLFPDPQGDLLIYDHLVIDQHGIDVVVPWDEGEQAELASEWQEPYWHRALVLRLIRDSYDDMDWACGSTNMFFHQMPFITDGYEDDEWQIMLREIIQW